MKEQHFSFHTLPAVFMLEAHLSENMVGTLNDYLDKLMVDEKRKSHAGTLVGQIAHGQQLTMDHFCEELNVAGKPYCQTHCDIAYIDEKELKKEKEAQKNRRIAAQFF